MKKVSHKNRAVELKVKTHMHHKMAIFMVIPERVYESGVIPCGISDHDLLFMTKKLGHPNLNLHHVLLIFKTKKDSI